MDSAQDRDPGRDEVQPEFRQNAGSGDLGAEETGPAGLGPESGSGSGHDYPGRAALGGQREDDEGPITDSLKPAEQNDQPAPERPPEQPPGTPDKPEGER